MLLVRKYACSNPPVLLLAGLVPPGARCLDWSSRLRTESHLCHFREATALPCGVQTIHSLYMTCIHKPAVNVFLRGDLPPSATSCAHATRSSDGRRDDVVRGSPPAPPPGSGLWDTNETVILFPCLPPSLSSGPPIPHNYGGGGEGSRAHVDLVKVMLMPRRREGS